MLVHDAARPLVSDAMIDAWSPRRARGRGAVAALPVVDTLKEVDDDGRIVRTVERARLWRAQTPQGFPREMIERAHARRARERVAATDDAALCERLGFPVRRRARERARDEGHRRGRLRARRGAVRGSPNERAPTVAVPFWSPEEIEAAIAATIAHLRPAACSPIRRRPCTASAARVDHDSVERLVALKRRPTGEAVPAADRRQRHDRAARTCT